MQLTPHNRFPRWLSGKESAFNEDLGSIPGLGRSHGEGNGNSFQYFCLKNSMNRGTWQATVHGVTKSRTQTHLATGHFRMVNMVNLTCESVSCSVVSNSATPQTVAPQAPLSMGILQARLPEWVTISLPEDLPNPGIESRSSTLQVDSV